MRLRSGKIFMLVLPMPCSSPNVANVLDAVRVFRALLVTRPCFTRLRIEFLIFWTDQEGSPAQHSADSQDPNQKGEFCRPCDAVTYCTLACGQARRPSACELTYRLILVVLHSVCDKLSGLSPCFVQKRPWHFSC